MKSQSSRLLAAAAALLLAFAVQAAPSQPARSSDWPAPADSVMTKSLNLLVPGMTAEQVTATLGRPDQKGTHANGQAWHYVMALPQRGAASNDVATCHLEVFYGKDGLTRQFTWSPRACNDYAWDAGVPAMPAAHNEFVPVPDLLIASIME